MRRPSLRLAGLAALAALVVQTSPAQAQLTSSGMNCSSGGAVGLMAALACGGGYNGNNMNQQGAVTSQMSSDFSTFTGAGTWWSYLGDANFSGQTNGTVSLDNPMTGYFVVLLKSSNQFSYYLYNGGTAGISTIDFTDAGTAVNKNGQVQGLSHASVYSWDGPTPPVTTTPEPGTIALVASGLAGLAVVRRKRQ